MLGTTHSFLFSASKKLSIEHTKCCFTNMCYIKKMSTICRFFPLILAKTAEVDVTSEDYATVVLVQCI